MSPRPARARWRRGHGDADQPRADWRPTDERFRDPRTKQVMRVWEDAAGARHYVPDDGLANRSRRALRANSWRSAAPAAEQPQEQQEHVEDVEEDRRSDQDRAVHGPPGGGG